MYILGINAYHGDAAAALLKDGILVAAAEEERFNRVKHSAGFPSRAIRYCLDEAGISARDIDHIAISRRPVTHLEKEIFFIVSGRPSYSKLIRQRLQTVMEYHDVAEAMTRDVGRGLRAEIHDVEHHQAHLASAFFVSPFGEAALLSLDLFGDFCSTMLGRGRDNRIEVLDKVVFPHSLGLFYTMVTQFLGFPKYGDEGKVMGLAACGEPKYLDEVRDIVRHEPGGLFTLNLDYFTHHVHGVDMSWDEVTPAMAPVYSEKMTDVFGPPRGSDEEITDHHRDIARSLQAALEEAVIHIARRLRETVESENLALAGGVALNCVTNSRLLKETPFENIFIQPAAGDAGTALGAAFYIWNQKLGFPRVYRMGNVFTGPAYSDREIGESLEDAGLRYEIVGDIAGTVANLVADGKIVGFFQGRMEFGPRALGHRSILADPRVAGMRGVLNERIKFREDFRPFAASILEEAVEEWFYWNGPSPYMLFVHAIREEKQGEIPAVVHVDGTCRIQTVGEKEAPLYHSVIKRFGELTGVPIVMNTSFNENEPIVCTPDDAIACFEATKMDALVIGKYLVKKGG
ncbi:MAG: carbamoyltransferase [Planctomycetota bacterium]|nr:MAG: carbamoyltransferase [Planctomycetota bacterium]